MPFPDKITTRNSAQRGLVEDIRCPWRMSGTRIIAQAWEFDRISPRDWGSIASTSFQGSPSFPTVETNLPHRSLLPFLISTEPNIHPLGPVVDWNTRKTQNHIDHHVSHYFWWPYAGGRSPKLTQPPASHICKVTLRNFVKCGWNPWKSPGIHGKIIWENQIVSVKNSRYFPMDFPWIFPWIFHGFFHDFPMDFPWFFHDFPLFSMIFHYFPWFSIIFHDFPGFSHGFSMVMVDYLSGYPNFCEFLRSSAECHNASSQLGKSLGG